MKLRFGFVSNSSSSSFIIKDKTRLSNFQYEKIMNHAEITDDPWDIVESDTDNSIEFTTWMDNFDLEEYARILGIIQADQPKTSFVIIDKNKLTLLQYNKIYNHAEIAGEHAWDIGEADKSILLSTNNKVFDLRSYCELLGVHWDNLTDEEEN